VSDGMANGTFAHLVYMEHGEPNEEWIMEMTRFASPDIYCQSGMDRGIFSE